MRALHPLMACYGGSHVQIISTLAKAMIARGDHPTVIGFTTAFQELRKQEINAVSVTSLLELNDDAKWLELAKPFTKDQTHPDIDPSETLAYFALGLRDLAENIGIDAALDQVAANGRKAFEPVGVMRRYLTKMRPDIVITTTSPRFETALLKAARLEGIPTLAIGDLFLVKERDWILDPGYAENLAVLSLEVANQLTSHGFPSAAIRVTGNPAFDQLATLNTETKRRKTLRKKLKLADKTVILYPSPSSSVSMIGRPFLDINTVVSELERFCQTNSNYTYIIRPHPNLLFELPSNSVHGYLDDHSTLNTEDAILVSDVIFVEASTVGLQAALAKRRVICIGFADYVLYPNYGLAQSTDTLTDAIDLLSTESLDFSSTFQMPPLGTATKNVLAFVDDIISPEQ